MIEYVARTLGCVFQSHPKHLERVLDEPVESPLGLEFKDGTKLGPSAVVSHVTTAGGAMISGIGARCGN
jgi:hypothetical protein